ncbi:MAG TPA: orotidine-5'-phosphate decarboxylase [Thermoplasmata archaeon]|nr:orotidine-5'-phosphate decarboxylase [Thermoplasmata archaeon]
MRLERRLILALDVTDPDRARSIAKSVAGEVDAIKVGWALFLSGGRDVLKDIARLGYLLADLRTAEIPNVTRLIVEQVVAMGASGIITQGFVGEDSVRAAVEAAGNAEVFVITEMSHPGGAEFTAPHAEAIARIAVRAGAAGIVAPATRPDRVRALRAIVGTKLILSPGVGTQGGSASAAIAAGADAVIVGRSILESANPAKAAKDIATEIAPLSRQEAPKPRGRSPGSG